VRHGLFPSGAVGADRVPGLLPAAQRVVPIRRRPTRQDGERLAAQPAQTAPYPNTVLPFVVCRLAPLPVSDDRSPLTQRAPARHLAQIDPRHPGTGLSSGSGNEIKRITAGVKACRWFSLPGLVRRPAFTLLVCSMSNEKRILLSVAWRLPSLRIGRYKGTWGQRGVGSPVWALPGNLRPNLSRLHETRRICRAGQPRLTCPARPDLLRGHAKRACIRGHVAAHGYGNISIGGVESTATGG